MEKNYRKSTILYSKGLELIEQERYREAMRELRASIRLNPDAVEVHYSLGLLHLLYGEKNAALHEYGLIQSLDENLGERFATFISSDDFMTNEINRSFT